MSSRYLPVRPIPHWPRCSRVAWALNSAPVWWIGTRTATSAVQILDSVRRKEVFLVQPTSPPVNDHLLELLALADACRRAGAARMTAIVPFFGYCRADKRHGKREPIMASSVIPRYARCL